MVVVISAKSFSVGLSVSISRIVVVDLGSAAAFDTGERDDRRELADDEVVELRRLLSFRSDRCLERDRDLSHRVFLLPVVADAFVVVVVVVVVVVFLTAIGVTERDEDDVDDHEDDRRRGLVDLCVRLRLRLRDRCFLKWLNRLLHFKKCVLTKLILKLFVLPLILILFIF
jgi:hypothetical protein